mmetsp:Transcript_23353/g.56640  ORF Transcript_23353/g.56640 Transcript_23353/m.56640 type:complete len:203 (-) Transcript_23353:292-900(-)
MTRPNNLAGQKQRHRHIWCAADPFWISTDMFTPQRMAIEFIWVALAGLGVLYMLLFDVTGVHKIALKLQIFLSTLIHLPGLVWMIWFLQSTPPRHVLARIAMLAVWIAGPLSGTIGLAVAVAHKTSCRVLFMLFATTAFVGALDLVLILQECKITLPRKEIPGEDSLAESERMPIMPFSTSQESAKIVSDGCTHFASRLFKI